MKIKRINKASLLVSVLIIFVFLTTIVLVVYVYSTTNLSHAKIQEEGLHAYYLAYSGCELAYEGLKKEAEDIPYSSTKTKWTALADKFSSTTDSTFLNKHKVSISYEGKKTHPDYPTRTEFWLEKSGKTSKPLSELLLEFKDDLILIEVTRVSKSAPPHGEEQYAGYIRIESIGIKYYKTASEVRATKILYIDPNNENKFFWR